MEAIAITIERTSALELLRPIDQINTALDKSRRSSHIERQEECDREISLWLIGKQKQIEACAASGSKIRASERALTDTGRRKRASALR